MKAFESGQSKFNVTHKSKYGPHLEKVNRQLDDDGNPIVPVEDVQEEVPAGPVRDDLDSFSAQYELSPKQRIPLREVLLAAGLTLVPMKDAGDNNGNDTEAPDHTYTTSASAPAPGYKYAHQAKAGVVDLTTADSLDGIDPVVAAEILSDTEAGPLSEFEKEVIRKQIELDEKDVADTYQLAQTPAEGTGDLSRLEFVKQAFVFDEETAKKRGWSIIPQVAWEEFSRLAPGWVGQESRFKESATSSSKAKGPYQYKDNAWEDTGRTGEVSRRYDEQAEATKDLIVKNYEYMLHYAGEALDVIEQKFDSEERFWVEFMVPLLLTAHNGGGPTVGPELKQFVEGVRPEQMSEGKDLVWQFIQESGLSDQAKAYARKVKTMWLALLLQEKNSQA